MRLQADQLTAACSDDSIDAGITIRTDLEPVAGPYSPVKPAIYEGGRYQLDYRWEGEPSDAKRVPVVVIDNVPSQANRLEAALESLRAECNLPEMVLDLSGLGELPPHLPTRLSSFRFPHRQADAYLRDADMNGESFSKSEAGKRLLSATAGSALALLEQFPQALLYGFWQSHLGKKGSQAKLARSWVSEIAGFDPATTDTRRLGLKGDPLNLSITDQVAFDSDDVAGWVVATGTAKTGKSKSKEALSEIGHGQVPIPDNKTPPGAISFRRIEQRSTVSFASLRRVHVGSAADDAVARALLTALGLLAHAAAFGRSFSLRSECDLRPEMSQWTWLGADGDTSMEPLDRPAAIALFRDCVAAGEAAGLPVGGGWSEPIDLVPNVALAEVIRLTYPKPD